MGHERVWDVGSSEGGDSSRLSLVQSLSFPHGQFSIGERGLAGSPSSPDAQVVRLRTKIYGWKKGLYLLVTKFHLNPLLFLHCLC